MKNDLLLALRRRGTYFAVLLCCAFTACHKQEKSVEDHRLDTLPEELLVVRSQPGVYMVVATGDVKLKHPREVSTRKSVDRSEPPWRDPVYSSLVHRQFQRDLHDGVIENSRPEIDYSWEKVTENPQKYLQASTEVQIDSLTGQYGSGSAFAVSREGILLTNAHVVSDAEVLDPNDANSVISILGQVGGPLDKLLSGLAAEFGGDPPQQWKRKAVLNLGRWLAGQSSAKATFRQAQVVVKFDSPKPTAQVRNAKPEELLGIAKQPITVPAKVREPKGQTIPGRDVAILQLDRGDPDLNLLLKDKLICLPLGDSDQVLPGRRIRAMGFPGIGFDPELMDPDARYRVSNPSGSIGPRKLMSGGGWEAFEMDAPINHGDSGGPVIDLLGNVIGLNVGAPHGISAGHNLAVPINLAKEFLRQAGINPDPGPITQLWVDGLTLYARQRYAEAQKKFEQVSRMQEGSPFPSVGGNSYRDTSPYVVEMIWRCRNAASKNGKT